MSVPSIHSGSPSIRGCLIRTLVQTVAIWTVALALVPVGISSAEDAIGLAGLKFTAPWGRAAGAATFIAAGSLGLWSGWTMAVHGRGTPLPLDPATRLVVAGPYRVVRNPMAIGGLAQGAGVGLWLGSPSVLLYVLCGYVLWNFGVRRWEERDLLRRFGDPYAEYRRGVRCWIPRWPPLPKGQRGGGA